MRVVEEDVLYTPPTHRNGLNIIRTRKIGGWYRSSARELSRWVEGAENGSCAERCVLMSTSYLILIGRRTATYCRYIISWTHIEDPTLKCSLLLLSKFIKKCRHEWDSSQLHDALSMLRMLRKCATQYNIDRRLLIA